MRSLLNAFEAVARPPSVVDTTASFTASTTYGVTTAPGSGAISICPGLVIGTSVYLPNGQIKPGWNYNPGIGRTVPAITNIDVVDRILSHKPKRSKDPPP